MPIAIPRPGRVAARALLATGLLGSGLIASGPIASPASAQPAKPAAPATTAPAPGAAPAPTAPAPGASAPGASAAPAANGAAAAVKDPVVARVNGQEIHLSDVQQAAEGLPDQYRTMPAQVLYPMLLDQLVDRLAVVAEARKMGLESDPAVKRAMSDAADQALENALLSKQIGPTITDAAVRARYDAQYANKKGEEEVHARHILVPTEAQAKDIIAQLDKGADFTALAKKYSTEPGAAQGGGDLGWFKKGDMLPEFSAAAFALKPGQITQTPVHTRYGWHVIQVLDTRQAPPPAFDEVKDQIRQAMIQEGVTKVLDQARSQAQIVRYNPDGSPMRATDGATPPAGPAGAAAGSAPGPGAAPPAASPPAPPSAPPSK